MQKLLKEYRDLLLPYEVLRARLDIRDFFLKFIVKQIYESTGQTLSLVRLQLSDNLIPITSGVATPGVLIEQVVKELRSMGRCFFPDEVMLPDEGIVAILAFAAAKIFREKPIHIVAEKEIILNETTELIVVKIILDALTLIKEKKGRVQQLIISQDGPVVFAISYQSKQPLLFENQDPDAPYLSIEERLKLVNGCCLKKITEAGHYQLILQVPKPNSYEQEH